MNQKRNKFDLEIRTETFGVSIIQFCKSLSQDTISRPLISQIVRSATSIGANYTEANGASSKKDFRNKIFICKKEARETLHWLKMLLAYFPDNSEAILKLRQEAHELVLIFGKISSSVSSI
jgi:four helix bundle protein